MQKAKRQTIKTLKEMEQTTDQDEKQFEIQTSFLWFVY
jgi:hypothetical protein